MKTFYTFCMMNLAFVTVFAQNYHCFNKDRPAYYQFASTDKIFYSQAAISIDSFKVMGIDTVFYHYPIIDVENYPCYLKAHDSSFVNTESHRLLNGNDIFFNRNHDSILFNNEALQNESWVMCHFANGDVMKATIQSVDEVAVLGSNDSVKTVTLQAQNSSGNNINHIFNGKKILIGKNTGFINGYSMFHFPADTIAFSIIGIENPSLGLNAAELTPAKIFDFNVGDRFDFERGDGFEPTTHVGSKEIDKILNKQISGNGDTLTYEVNFQRFIEGNNWADIYQYVITGTEQWVFIVSSLDFLKMRPFEYFEKDFGSHYHLLAPSGYDLMATDLRDEPYYVMFDWQESDCLNSTVNDLYTDDYYSTGLGRTSSDGGYIGSGVWTYENLLYYNKGGIEWGDSLNWDVLTGMENTINSNQFAVYPNPADDFVFIQGNFTPDKTEFKVFNALGKEMSLKNLSFESESVKLDLTGLLAGMYFIQIKNGNQMLNSKFLKH